MSRTNLPITALHFNAGIAFPAGTTVDQANGMNVALASTAIPSASSSDKLVFYVTNTDTSSHNFTVRAGAGAPSSYGPAFRNGLGDLTVSVANAGKSLIGPLEVARFVQADGSINVDFAASFAGVIIAMLLDDQPTS